MQKKKDLRTTMLNRTMESNKNPNSWRIVFSLRLLPSSSSISLQHTSSPFFSFLPFPFLSFFSLSSFLLALRTPILKRKPTFSRFQFCFLCTHPLFKENLLSLPFNFHAHTHSPKRATSEVKWFNILILI